MDSQEIINKNDNQSNKKTKKQNIEFQFII